MSKKIPSRKPRTVDSCCLTQVLTHSRLAIMVFDEKIIALLFLEKIALAVVLHNNLMCDAIVSSIKFCTTYSYLLGRPQFISSALYLS